MCCRRWFQLMFACLMPIVVCADPEPFDFKGIALGSSVSDLKTKNPEFYCEIKPGQVVSDTTCHLSEETKCLFDQAPYLDNRTCRAAVIKARTYAGIPARAITMYYYADKLAMVRIQIGSDDFTKVVEAIKRKHGAPSDERAEKVTNRMGAIFESKVIEWKGVGSGIKLEQYGSRLNESCVSVYADAWYAEYERRNGEQTRQGASDL